VQSFFKAKEISGIESQATLDKVMMENKSSLLASVKMEIN